MPPGLLQNPSAVTEFHHNNACYAFLYTGMESIQKRSIIVEMALWEKILLGVGVLLIILWFRPGIKAAWKRSQEAENKDWGSLLLPIGMVVIFVILLILMVRN